MVARTEREPGRISPQKSLLADAVASAVRGDVKGMLEALTSSSFLDGLVRQLADQYDPLPRHEVETCVAEAVDQFFSAVRSGRRVTNPGGWLWKVAWNMARDTWLREYSGRESLDEDCAPAADDENLYDRATAEDRLDRLRKEALQHARALAPQIGQGQVVEVLQLLLDAVAQGLPDLPAKDVAETLGIEEAAARSLMSRALQRLERAARTAGITLPDDLAATVQDVAGESTPDFDL